MALGGCENASRRVRLRIHSQQICGLGLLPRKVHNPIGQNVISPHLLPYSSKPPFFMSTSRKGATSE